MEIKVTKAALLDALKKAQKVVSSKAAVPVLQNVLIEAQDGKVVATCSDLTRTIVATTTCEVIEEGRTTLPAKMLSSVISAAGDGQIEIKVNEKDRAVIKSGQAKFTLNGLPATEFPKLPKISGEPIELPSAKLKEMLRYVKYAASQDETRATIRSVLLDFKDSAVSAVATDGRRLAKFDATLEAEVADSQWVIPIASVADIYDNLASEGNVAITIATSQMVVDFGTVKVYTKMLEDAYPNYRQVIPSSFGTKVVVSRDELLSAIGRVSVFANDGAASTVTFNFSAGELVLSASTTDVGESRDSIAIKYDSEKAIEIRFNPVYVNEAISAMEDDELAIYLNDGHSPCKISRVDTDDFTYVLMPLRVNS